MKEAVLALTASDLPVMTSRDQSILDVEVHASVLALVEAYNESARRAMPWPTLIAAAAASEGDDALRGLDRVHSGRPSMVRNVLTDLMALGLMVTSPAGLRITSEGLAMVRAWNGQYSDRLAAARELLERAALTPPDA